MSWGMLLRTSRILMEATPDAVDIEALKNAVDSLAGVSSIYHVHVWELDEDRNALEAHILVESGTQMEQVDLIKETIRNMLKERFQIEHSTLEFGANRTDTEGC
jgi:cobalt-zinc-cadmium efflux system protein